MSPKSVSLVLFLWVTLVAFGSSETTNHPENAIISSPFETPAVVTSNNIQTHHHNSVVEPIASPPIAHHYSNHGIKGMIKKRLRPGLANLGRGVIRATLSKDAIISRARSLLTKPSISTSSSNSSLKKKQSRQSPGLVAGALAYGLTALPLITLPLLFMGPVTKLFKKEEEEKEEEKIYKTMNQIFNVATELLSANINASGSSGTKKLAQAMGLNPSNLSDEPSKPNSAAAATASGDAFFAPGLFNSNNNFIKNGKYKQYVYKQGVVTPKPKPVTTTADPMDSIFERRSGAERKSDTVDKEEESVASLVSKDNLASIAKDVLRTVSDGIKNFELDKSECKERLVCEVSQKYSGASFKSWATALMHVLDIDTRVEKSKVGKNAVLRTIYRGARSSLSPDKTCADLFPGCA